uniref:Uncharacterized protein n=1 Tax=Magallana gigas TaxID=29159 RepID=A0A8W8JHW5_MAGGI
MLVNNFNQTPITLKTYIYVSYWNCIRLRMALCACCKIGENDICESKNSEKLARDILSVGQYLRDGVGVKTTEHLKRFAEPRGGIYFWGHRGFWKEFHLLGLDGVHLLCTPAEDQPMRKFRRSIRNAVILHSKVLGPPLCHPKREPGEMMWQREE